MSRLIDLLREREGWRDAVYLDTNGNPTAGLGHLLNDAERQAYPVGSVVPDGVLQAWAVEDVAWASGCAADVCRRMGGCTAKLRAVAGSMCFQLGPAWPDRFPELWEAMQARRWKDAAALAKETRWAEQTPKRVADLADALDTEPRIPLDIIAAALVVALVLFFIFFLTP